MKSFRKWRVFLLCLALLLSHAMCGVVAYHYGRLQGGVSLGYSAPPDTAFVYAVPFGMGIAVCLLLSLVLYRKEKRGGQ